MYNEEVLIIWTCSKCGRERHEPEHYNEGGECFCGGLFEATGQKETVMAVDRERVCKILLNYAYGLGDKPSAPRLNQHTKSATNALMTLFKDATPAPAEGVEVWAVRVYDYGTGQYLYEPGSFHSINLHVDHHKAVERAESLDARYKATIVSIILPSLDSVTFPGDEPEPEGATDEH